MASRGLEVEIDRLYQLPLEDFTTARNALAKGAGGDAARIRGLAKPPIAAWAVNQLYWQDRETWNVLLAAAENARRAQRAVLGGRQGDVRAANKVHDDAVAQALRATVALLTAADQAPTDATKHAIGVTLRALPGDEAPGRLTRALQPAGFETLAGLSVAAGAARPAKPAPPRVPSAAATPASGSVVDAKALTRARQEAAAAARVLRDAENEARRDEFEKVRTEREEARAGEAVEKAREAAGRAASELKDAEAAATRAARLRETAARTARDAQRALAGARERAEATAAEVSALEKGIGGRKNSR
jgi:hypothetical protein